MGAARASQPGMKVVSVYFEAELWDWLRQFAFPDTSASAVVVQRIRELRDASQTAQRKTREGAIDITLERRRRSEEPDD